MLRRKYRKIYYFSPIKKEYDNGKEDDSKKEEVANGKEEDYDNDSKKEDDNSKKKKTSPYRLTFICSCRFMQTKLSDLIDNLSEIN